MRNKTQERVEELARERGVASIDLALVEDGIEFGKQMMAEMIATYSGPPAQGAANIGAGGRRARESAAPGGSPARTDVGEAAPDTGGGGYLNEVRSR